VYFESPFGIPNGIKKFKKDIKFVNCDIIPIPETPSTTANILFFKKELMKFVRTDKEIFEVALNKFLIF